MFSSTNPYRLRLPNKHFDQQISKQSNNNSVHPSANAKPSKSPSKGTTTPTTGTFHFDASKKVGSFVLPSRSKQKSVAATFLMSSTSNNFHLAKVASSKSIHNSQSQQQNQQNSQMIESSLNNPRKLKHSNSSHYQKENHSYDHSSDETTTVVTGTLTQNNFRVRSTPQSWITVATTAKQGGTVATKIEQSQLNNYISSHLNYFSSSTTTATTQHELLSRKRQSKKSITFAEHHHSAQLASSATFQRNEQQQQVNKQSRTPKYSFNQQVNTSNSTRYQHLNKTLALNSAGYSWVGMNTADVQRNLSEKTRIQPVNPTPKPVDSRQSMNHYSPQSKKSEPQVYIAASIFEQAEPPSSHITHRIPKAEEQNASVMIDSTPSVKVTKWESINESSNKQIGDDRIIPSSHSSPMKSPCKTKILHIGSLNNNNLTRGNGGGGVGGVSAAAAVYAAVKKSADYYNSIGTKSSSTEATNGYGSSDGSNVAFDIAMMSINSPQKKGKAHQVGPHTRIGMSFNPRGKTVESGKKRIQSKFLSENKNKAHDEFIESFFLNPNNIAFRR